MFNRDALFGRRDEPTTTNNNTEARSVNVTPGLNTMPTMRPQAEPPKTDLRFAEPARAPARAEEPKGSRLIVGPDIKLKGVEISNCDTLVVEGRVEASMDSRVVEIAEDGVFSGTVSIDVAEIRGRFEGELTARKQLVIYSTGRVTGRIRYGKIRIEEGGELTGDVSTLTGNQPAQQPAQQQKQQQQPAQAAQPAQPAPQPAAAQQPQAASQKTANPPQPQAQPQPAQPAPQKQATVASASSAEKPRYEPVPRAGKQNGKGASAS